MSNYIDNIVKNAVTYDLVSKPLADDMANEFSIQSTYAVGDYVMHDYKLYKCISAVTTAGNWNSAKWQECKIGDEINGGVKFTAQTLTSEQKAQARNNIGGASQADLEALNAVRYDQAQTLTTAQKTQARANIGAVSQEEATPDAIRYSAQSLTDAQKNQARVNVGTVESTSIAEEFSTSKAYAVGDMVMYNSKLYKFKTAHSAGAWNNAQVDAISVDDELLNLKGDLGKITVITTKLNDFVSGFIVLSGEIGSQISLKPYFNSAWECLVIACSSGDRFYVDETGANSGRAWAFVDDDNILLSKSESGLITEEIEAPQGSTKAIFNNKIEYSKTVLKLYGTDAIGGLRNDVQNVLADVKEVEDSFNELGLQHVNLYTRIGNTPQSYITDDDGVIHYGTNFQTSDYIDVSDFQGQYINASYTFSGVFYGADKTTLKGKFPNTEQIDQSVLVPSDANYARVSCRNANEPLMQIGLDITRANYVPHECYVLKNMVQVDRNQIETKTTNLFDKANVSPNTTIKTSGDTAGDTTSGTGFNASGFIDIGSGEYVTIFGAFNAIIYHDDKSFSRAAVRRYSDYPYTILLNEDEQYVRITVRNALLDSAIVEKNIGLSEYVAYGGSLDVNNVDASLCKTTKIYVGENCGFSSINDALSAITDNSPKNRYTIFVTEGTYNETITTKDYVDIEGENRYKSIINYISDDESDYVHRSAIFASTYTTIKNLTVRTTGSKYPLHCDARYNEPYEVKCEKCTFQHDGFTGESQPAGTAVGIGLYWGQHVSLDMCDCIGSGTYGVAAVYCHNSSEADAAHSRFRSLSIKNCRLSNATYGLRLQAIEQNQLQENECIYIGNKNTASTPVLLEASTYQSWHVVSVGNAPEYSQT